MSFDPYNYPLKIRKSIGTPTAKVGVHLGVWGFIPSYFLIVPGACNVTPKLHFWPAPLQALAFVVNPRLGLWQLRYMFEQLQCLNGEFNSTSSFYKNHPIFSYNLMYPCGLSLMEIFFHWCPIFLELHWVKAH
jgi:hypothetical protein